MKSIVLSAVALAFSASAASAAISVDGSLDAGYGAAKSTVGWNPAAPTSNFGTPTNENHTTSYTIYGTIDGDTLYGFWQADPDQAGETNVGNFLNLYLDTDPAVSGGSDLGFEITNDSAFRPGVAGYSAPLGLSFATGANSVEFAIPLSMLRDGIASLPQFTADKFVAEGGRFTFRLSQAFGYSVAGGASYGDDRLGSFIMPNAVPEPASWAMMIGGFALAGGAMRRRGRATTVLA